VSSFLSKVLVILVILLVAVVLLSVLGGDGGTLPFDYEGFD
jgi:hypothetical protein